MFKLPDIPNGMLFIPYRSFPGGAFADGPFFIFLDYFGKVSAMSFILSFIC